MTNLANTKKQINMANYKITIQIEADSAEQAKAIATGLQKASKKVKGASLEKMLKLLDKNPQWIETAIKFV